MASADHPFRRGPRVSHLTIASNTDRLRAPFLRSVDDTENALSYTMIGQLRLGRALAES